MKNKIAVLDFGGQYAHLIANRVRRLGVYSEILDNETPASQLAEYKGIILSGGPDSVNDVNAPKCDPAIFQLSVPILAICYGHQLMQSTLGGSVDKGEVREYGLAELNVEKKSGIFKDFSNHSRVWMSHFDMVKNMAEGFESIGTTEDCPTAAIANFHKNYYGIQFHMEVTHTEEGQKLLNNFLNICKVEKDWNIKIFLEKEMKRIKEKIGNKKVFLLVSGGVDSTVCFALLQKALGSDKVYGMLVDTGLMRHKEAEKVQVSLKKAGFNQLYLAEKQDLFLKRLKGIFEPEAKRKIIGELFLEVKESVSKELKLNPEEWIMGQGTIYPDTIETGGTKHADKIKTHHNRVDIIQKMIAEGKVIEPIADLYKDEVRELGETLGLPHELIWRQPFPGPGLGVRILCSSEEDLKNTPNFSKLNREVNTFIQNKYSVDLQAVVLPCKSVGVQGDERTYKHPVALFGSERDWNLLEKISTSISNRFSEINRVILNLKGERANFQLKLADINEERVRLLQKVDEEVNQIMQKAEKDYDIWQFPVVLVPVSTKKDKESIILRPIVSTEAMTASFARIDKLVLSQLSEIAQSQNNISHIFYDLTHKPPGTIEWE